MDSQPDNLSSEAFLKSLFLTFETWSTVFFVKRNREGV